MLGAAAILPPCGLTAGRHVPDTCMLAALPVVAPALSKRPPRCLPPPGPPTPSQRDEFLLRLPPLGALRALRVGHDGPRDWHLDRVEVTDCGSGTTYRFPCEQWVVPSGSSGSGGMGRTLQVQVREGVGVGVGYQYARGL